MDGLTISNRLYGRDHDIGTLLESFERISSGQGEVMLVHGRSGAGKTALVHELQAPIRARNGFFISGKFNQYQQNIPYFAFKQALAELCLELQGADPRQHSRLKSEMLQAIGRHGQLLVDLVPEFESFLGPQPPLGAVTPQEARHRFVEVFRNFLKTVCRPEHPLVLFIDDWQWADQGSFELLKQIQVGSTLRYFLAIASYRDDEVDAGHPLLSAVADLRIHSVPVVALAVDNITVNDVREIVADTLKPAALDAAGLAGIIHGKTLGNPFFVRSFLLFLYESGIVWFDDGQNCWQWRMDNAAPDQLPCDVVELFARKLRHLDAQSRNLFSLAACLGNRFDLATLGIISGLDQEQCRSLLFSQQARNIFRVPDHGAGNSSSQRAPQYCFFLHDRLQQAAYMLIDPDDRPALLLQIGRLLLASLHPEQLAERLFEVVNDLNAGYDLLQDSSERVRVVELNQSAARKAYDATAYSSALLYYRAAARFLEQPEFAEQLWRDCHEMTMSLFKELAVCEFLVGDRNEAENCIRRCVARSESPLEKADAFCILIVQYTLLARYPEAIAAGRQALKTLQITLPEGDYQVARNWEIAQVRQVLAARPVSSLAELPVMRAPEMLMASKILITMGPPCYRSHQELWSVIVPKVVNLTLRHGNIPQIGYSHTAFGGLLGWVDDDYLAAKEFGAVATRLMSGTFTNPTDQSVFYLMIGSSIRHWSEHLSCGSQDYRDAYEIGLRSGNLQYAAYAFGHNMYCQFYQGVPLSGLMQESQRSLEFSRIRLNRWAIDLLEGGLQVFGRLSDQDPGLDGSEAWCEEEYLGRVEEHRNIQVACIYKIIKAFSLLVLGDHEGALELSDQAEPLLYTVGTQGLLPWPEHLFSRFLLICALYPGADAARQGAWRPELDRMIDRIRVWAEHCAENFEHKYLLAAAELARIEGRALEAGQLYDRAVEAAQSGNFLQWMAIANERAHRFWLDAGHERLAQSYWQQAYICYARWGAVAKVNLMESAYRISLAEHLPESDGGAGSQGREIKDALLEKQIAQLREYAFQMQQNALRVEALTQAKELARATQQLRIEIAERKRTEEALRESEDRFKKLFMEAPLGIALIDSLSGQIYEVNPMFARIAGRTMEEMVQTDWLKITHPDDVQKDLDHMALMNSGKTRGFQMEKRYLLPGGDPVWINMTIAPVDVKDKSSPRHLCMIEDITARKQAEKQKQEFDLQLLQTQKLESLGVLAGGIAHDFNNILMAIIGNADLALMKLPPGSPVTENLRAIDTASARAADLAKQMLAYSGKGRFLVESIDLNRLLDEMLHMLKVSISKKAVLCLNTSVEVPTVEADATQMRQVIMNLVINASEAIGDRGGLIAINVGCMECDRDYLKNSWLDEGIAEGTYVCLEISDTGCGMDQETATKIFDPFFTTKFTGRGLGMAAVLGIIRGHKGAIRVFSEPGKGSTFKLLIPASKNSSRQQKREAESEAWSSSGKVLLVDDEESVQAAGSMMLRALGFTPIVAGDGGEAIEICKSTSDIAFVILDLTMPRMDGEQCFRELRKLNPDLKVIMSSGYHEQEVTQRFLGQGLTSFIQKPYKLSKLSEVIKALGL